ILMTTLAMIFGMAPAAVGFGAGAELRQPMGISVVGGLITSTLLTLVVVPVAYSLIDDLGNWLLGRSQRKKSQQPHLSGNGARAAEQMEGLVLDRSRAPRGALDPARKGKELD
ncbi:MAG TPA: efflux RND transporter permease subunit, partial [Chloroflexota bacterium]|nr:efflux RND transporter permease subunit [Chloroflexota bacterium]